MSRTSLTVIVDAPGDETPSTFVGPPHMKGHFGRRPRSPLIASDQVPALQLAQKLSKVATQHQRMASGWTSSSYLSVARSRLNDACNNLSKSIVAGLKMSTHHIAEACDWLVDESSSNVYPPHSCTVTDDGCIQCNQNDTSIRAGLQVALVDLQKRLSGIIDSGEREDNRSAFRGVAFEDEMTPANWLDDEDRFRIAFYMIALLDLAKETQHLFDLACNLRDNAQPKKWIFPKVIWPWSKVTPEMPAPTGT